jgi:hypothetical protein
MRYAHFALLAVGLCVLVWQIQRSRRERRRLEVTSRRLTALLHDSLADQGYRIITDARGVRRNEPKWS